MCVHDPSVNLPVDWKVKSKFVDRHRILIQMCGAALSAVQVGVPVTTSRRAGWAAQTIV
jgi:hypothetical protein